MAIDTPAGLKAKMPLGEAAGTSVQDLHDLVDTFEDRTTQNVIFITTNYAVQLADNRRKIVVNSATPVTITFPNNTPGGFELLVIQGAAGAGVLSSPGGAILSRDNHTRTAGGYSVIYAVCMYNDSLSPQIILTGDSAP